MSVDATSQEEISASQNNGVFVFSQTQEDGSVAVVFEIIGKVDPLAIPSLLEHGSRLARKRIGLPV